MEYWQIFKASTIITSIAWIIVTLIREKSQNKRIDKLSKIKNSKIKAIGDYKNKSKRKSKFKRV